MKITGFGTISSTSSVQKKPGKGRIGAFADLLGTAETEVAAENRAASEVSAPAALSNLLALQEISEDDVQRRKQVQQGNAMLDALEGLRRQILSGTATQTTLDEIEKQLAISRQHTADQRLNAIMDDIELRVAVEMAKLQMARARQG